jgi:hypothetical protein
MPQISGAVSDFILREPCVKSTSNEAAFIFAHWRRTLQPPKYSLKDLGEIKSALTRISTDWVVGGRKVCWCACSNAGLKRNTETVDSLDSYQYKRALLPQSAIAATLISRE